MSYSIDFRRKVFEIKAKKGLTFEETSEQFGIGIRTLFRWQKRLEPITKRNKPATKIDMDALLRDVQDYPDDYQHERAQRFGVSVSAIGSALKRLGVTRKKKSETSQSQRKSTYQVSTRNSKV